MINYDDLKNKFDEAFAKETSETLTEWINSKRFSNEATSLEDIYKAEGKEYSGFFDLPISDRCKDPSHNPPTHIYIPKGKGYKHVCPSCGKVFYLIPPQISF